MSALLNVFHSDKSSSWSSKGEYVCIVPSYSTVASLAQSHGSARSKSARISTLQEYREHVAIPYLDSLIENINEMRLLQFLTSLSFLLKEH